MVEFGTVIMKENIIFKTNNPRRKGIQFDHAKGGRPALIIGVNDDYLYYLTLTSKKDGRKIYPYYYELQSDWILRDSYINLKNIYRQEICGHNEIGEIDEVEMLKIADAFIKYQSALLKKDPYFAEVLPLVKESLNKYKNKRQK